MSEASPTPSEARTLVSCRASVLVALASHLEQHSDPPNEDPNSAPDGFNDADVTRLLEVARPSFPWLTKKILLEYVVQHRRLYGLDREGQEFEAAAKTPARGRPRSRGRPKKGAAAAPASDSRATRATRRGGKKTPAGTGSDDDDEQRGRSRSASRGRGRDDETTKALLAEILPPSTPRNQVLPESLMDVPRGDPDNKSETKFYEMIDLLRQFRDEKGHSRVPDTLRYEKDNKYCDLSKWVMEVRRTYKKMQTSNPVQSTNLNAERISALGALGFEFRIIDPSRLLSWDERLDLCRKFREEHGHLCIPVSHPELGQWCSHMRTQHKINREGNAHSKSMRNGKVHKRTFLTPTREEQLDELGFVWQVRKRRRVGDGGPKPFEVRFGELEAFKEAHGHLRVTRALDPDLYGWVCYQRSDYRLMIEGKKHHMTADKLKQLNEIGFVFTTSRGGGGGKKARRKPTAEPEGDGDDMADDMTGGADEEMVPDMTGGADAEMVAEDENDGVGGQEDGEEDEEEEEDEDDEDEEDEDEDDDDDDDEDESDELEDQDLGDEQVEDLGAPDPHMF